MRKSLPWVLLFVSTLVFVMSAWVRQVDHASVGREASFDLQSTPASIPMVEPGPQRSLTLVDFFAGY